MNDFLIACEILVVDNEEIMFYKGQRDILLKKKSKNIAG